MEMQLSKGRDGWKAETHIELDGGRWLDISTWKSNGGIRSRVHCYRREGSFRTYALFQDYNATLATSTARCTEKAVAELHRQALAKLDEVKAAVTAFYAAKGQA